MGESIFEATVLGWLKAVGEDIEQDESLIEVATDKVDTEVPSTKSGKLLELLVQEGDVVKIGQVIAVLDVDEEGAEQSQISVEKQEVVVEDKNDLSVIPGLDMLQNEKPNEGEELKFDQSDRFYSPLVRNIAKEEGISNEELENITGTGRDNRVTKDDILGYLKSRKSGDNIQASPASVAVPKEKVSVSASDEIIEMDRMRKMIADRMLESKRISPHVTSFVEADVTEIVDWRKKNKDAFKKRHGENLTFTPIFVEAIAKALRDFPMINISVEGDRIIKKKDVNIGMAVALPNGNLIVPVIRKADELNLTGLAKSVNDLALRARSNKLTADDLSGGTYTMTNIGSFGNLSGTPIIMQPQVGILALGAIVKKPAVVETPQGDFIGIRHKMILSHSYDHRVVDGALGGMFVKRVAEYLEGFDVNQNI
ncbi:2-oxoglutarate dehydrogenase E2 component (dihydrolipoamide succinyltransferase) [Aureibacter tunicatorum]|uniref:Dihydrolipoamide acetyltransferase component of pyruvate dehydrogenase complex n=2 Tax=Aureibacter tunicatorum TaxID=866807 RepID=A0AAE3XS13_9BACT|nr:2-oxoglutarate dehydrogenase E2 component (dihydrolipoamide succinyltransferase) [Aureibacter tunicatorum]BDD03695.1 dihydrolipoamide acetyltransferase component of pyruvate dehydrogenase complex [Aureibacter tunicatorum]